MSSNLTLLIASHPVVVAAFALPLAYGLLVLAREIATALVARRRPATTAAAWTANADVSAALERSAIH